MASTKRKRRKQNIIDKHIKAQKAASATTPESPGLGRGEYVNLVFVFLWVGAFAIIPVATQIGVLGNENMIAFLEGAFLAEQTLAGRGSAE